MEEKEVEIIDGKELAKKIREGVKDEILTKYVSQGKDVPCLVCIIVGENKASKIYVRSKEKACAECGMKSLVYEFSEKTTKEELKTFIRKLNEDNGVSGILVQLPLPEKLDEFRDEIINTISPEKDVDCLTDVNLGKMYAGTGKIAPCTATGVIRILDSEGYDLDGKDVVVVGRSLLVGKSVSTLLQQRNATVTNCHSHTQDLKGKCERADVLVVAVGKPQMITKDYVKDCAFVVDVGINRLPSGLVGDVDFDDVKDKTSYITPVPGGVGPLTVACLMENTLLLHNERTLLKKNEKENLK